MKYLVVFLLSLGCTHTSEDPLNLWFQGAEEVYSPSYWRSELKKIDNELLRISWIASEEIPSKLDIATKPIQQTFQDSVSQGTPMELAKLFESREYAKFIEAIEQRKKTLDLIESEVADGLENPLVLNHITSIGLPSSIILETFFDKLNRINHQKQELSLLKQKLQDIKKHRLSSTKSPRDMFLEFEQEKIARRLAHLGEKLAYLESSIYKTTHLSDKDSITLKILSAKRIRDQALDINIVSLEDSFHKTNAILKPYRVKKSDFTTLMAGLNFQETWDQWFKVKDRLRNLRAGIDQESAKYRDNFEIFINELDKELPSIEKKLQTEETAIRTQMEDKSGPLCTELATMIRKEKAKLQRWIIDANWLKQYESELEDNRVKASLSMREEILQDVKKAESEGRIWILPRYSL